MTTPQESRFGWHDDPHEVERVVSRMRHPVMGLAAGHDFLTSGDDSTDVMMWKLEEKLLGRILPAYRQTIGDCVSQGWARAVRVLLLKELIDHEFVKEEFVDIATEPIYALSRVEVGGGRISGDGSIGAWAAEGVQAPYGVLQRKVYGSVDLTTYSGSRAREWGRRGLADDLEAIARNYPVSMAPLVVTDDEAKSALRNWYPIPVCSNQGFTESRDRYGFCDPRGSWAHCMCAIGLVEAKRGSNFVLSVPIQQSWGESPTGPNEIELRDGSRHTLPQGVFLIEFDVFVNRMLRARDSFAPAGPKGFIPALNLAL